MKIKNNDIEYLGVNKKKILKAQPLFNEERLKLYLHYIVERQNVLKKRQQGLPYPWTDDEIIKNNSFTNNNRFNDRYSIYVLNNMILFFHEYKFIVIYPINVHMFLGQVFSDALFACITNPTGFYFSSTKVTSTKTRSFAVVYINPFSQSIISGSFSF